LYRRIVSLFQPPWDSPIKIAPTNKYLN